MSCYLDSIMLSENYYFGINCLHYLVHSIALPQLITVKQFRYVLAKLPNVKEVNHAIRNTAIQLNKNNKELDATAK